MNLTDLTSGMLRLSLLCTLLHGEVLRSLWSCCWKSQT